MQEEQFWILVSKKITGEASLEELKILGELLAQNPTWKADMENLEEFWASRNEMEDSHRLLKAEDAYHNLIKKMELNGGDSIDSDHQFYNPSDEVSSKKSGFSKKRISILAAFLATTIAVIAYNILPVHQQNDSAAVVTQTSTATTNEIAIGAGSRSKILLPDGSQAWINASSKLTYSKSFSPEFREVYLEGEAYFDVVHDPKHPFIVHTSSLDIRAVGTAFNVKSYSTDPTIEATLIHGCIEVTRPDQPNAPKVVLKPHEKMVFNKNVEPRLEGTGPEESHLALANTISIKPLKVNIPDSDIAETAWIYNKLIFEDTRMADLARQMEKWYDVRIHIDSQKLADYTLTGSFVNENITEALKILQYLVPFRYEMKDRDIRIFEK